MIFNTNISFPARQKLELTNEKVVLYNKKKRNKNYLSNFSSLTKLHGEM